MRITDLSSKFGTYLKNYRLEKGLTQWKLGEEIGVSQQAISSYECGRRFPQSYIKREFAKFFVQPLFVLFYK